MKIAEISHSAHRMDDLNSPEFTEWLGLMRQADRLRRDLINVRAQGRFVAALEQHGSPAEAVQAATDDIDELTQAVEQANAAFRRANRDREQLKEALNPVTTALIDEARELRERNAALSGERGEIQRSRERRERAIGELMEAGLGRELAEQQARPAVADIDALEQELADIPGDMERNSALMSSYSGRLELYLAGADSDNDEDDEAAA